MLRKGHSGSDCLTWITHETQITEFLKAIDSFETYIIWVPVNDTKEEREIFFAPEKIYRKSNNRPKGEARTFIGVLKNVFVQESHTVFRKFPNIGQA